MVINELFEIKIQSWKTVSNYSLKVLHNKASLDYYPFGSPMPGRSITASSFYTQGYQGQQEDEEMRSIRELPKKNKKESEQTGFNAFELRLYDARIGGWLSPDPYNQHHSPYMAMSNNPLSFIDPDGGKTLQLLMVLNHHKANRVGMTLNFGKA